MGGLHTVTTIADEFARSQEFYLYKSRNSKVTVIRPPQFPYLHLPKPPLLPYNVYSHFYYPKEFNAALKAAIKRRDKFTCQVCNLKNVPLHIHHVNYNKTDCRSANLITLCKVCHKKTTRNRKLWYEILWIKMMRIYPPLP